jgi:Condensation domain
VTAVAVGRRQDRGPAPLSASQQRLWFLDQWEPGSFTQNAARAVRIRGPLDVEALHDALRTVVERHEGLRTVFRVFGREPKQVVLDDWELAFPVVDLTTLPQRERHGRLEGGLRELSQEPFDLANDLMFRTTLFRLGDDHHVLLVRMHHIAGDAFTVDIIFREVSAVYAARLAGVEPQLPDVPVQYADFAWWQSERLQGEWLERLEGYWTSELRDAPTLLPLPTDRPRRAVQRHDGGLHEVQLPGEVATRVRAVARAEGCTVYMVMVAAFATFLYRLTGTDDVVVGTPIAGRVSRELLSVVGFFSNTIALRIRLGGNPAFREVCARVRTAALGAYEHQELPFERVVELLNVPRDPSHNPLFQVNFRAEDGARRPLSLEGTETALLPVAIGFSRFDLALELHVAEEVVDGYFEYDRDLFDASTVAAFADDFAAVLEQVLADPGLPVLAVRLPNRRAAAEPAPRSRISRTRTTTRT